MGNCNSMLEVDTRDAIMNPIIERNHPLAAQNVFILRTLPTCFHWQFISIYHDHLAGIVAVEMHPFGGNLAIISDTNYQPGRTKGRGRVARNRKRRQKAKAAQLIAPSIQVVDEYGHLVSMQVDIKFTFNDDSIINLIWFDRETSYFEDTNGNKFRLIEQFYAMALSDIHRESKFILYCIYVA